MQHTINRALKLTVDVNVSIFVPDKMTASPLDFDFPDFWPLSEEDSRYA